MATETVTTLNPGVGGDAMDESQVTQSDGVTAAKRPNVVLGGPKGQDLIQPVREQANDGGTAYVLPGNTPTKQEAVMAQQANVTYQLFQAQLQQMRSQSQASGGFAILPELPGFPVGV